MLLARLQRLADASGVSVSRGQIDQFAVYLNLLTQWNKRINLTGLELECFPDSTLDKLIGEPLRAVRGVPPGIERWIDFGSGGGSPAVPLKIVFPDTGLWMVESRAKKAAFLREVSRFVGLTSTTVVCDRIEGIHARALAPHPHWYVDLITLRGIRITEGVAAVIEALLKPGGRLLLFGGSNLPSSLRAALTVGAVVDARAGLLAFNRCG
jgi:16S rRNA (guanine527-N7)-methyltransferase